MRLSSTLLLLISILFLSSRVFAEEGEAEDFAGEFFQGMESGFFLRDATDGHREYECPDPRVDWDNLNKITQILGPVQMMLGMMENDMITTAMASFETIINSVFHLIAAVEKYPGSEFCQGLLFGISGSSLIIQMGKIIMTSMDFKF